MVRELFFFSPSRKQIIQSLNKVRVCLNVNHLDQQKLKPKLNHKHKHYNLKVKLAVRLRVSKVKVKQALGGSGSGRGSANSTSVLRMSLRVCSLAARARRENEMVDRICLAYSSTGLKGKKKK